jgi:hypothetical protein
MFLFLQWVTHYVELSYVCVCVCVWTGPFCVNKKGISPEACFSRDECVIYSKAFSHYDFLGRVPLEMQANRLYL